MTCAGCDDCPQDAWHLHVTVKPHWSWSLTDVASALQRDIERHDIKPIVITNHFGDGRPAYRELIPTKHMKGTEADASREIFRMGVLLNNAGWRVKRLKIEGDARNPTTARRALYFETHLKNAYIGPNDAPRSSNTKGDVIHTIRREYIGEINVEMKRFQALYEVELPHTIEATVLDTNPDLDKDWINQ